MSAKKNGRPPVYSGELIVMLKPSTEAPKLQRNSPRREVIDFLLERNGSCTLADAAAKFGRVRILALVRAEWLTLTEPKESAA